MRLVSLPAPGPDVLYVNFDVVACIVSVAGDPPGSSRVYLGRSHPGKYVLVSCTPLEVVDRARKADLWPQQMDPCQTCVDARVG